MQLEYRIRIRNASTVGNPDGTADALTITSTPAGTNPHITEAPSGDGREVDPLTGIVRDGAYVVRIADAVTGTDGTGTLRLITQQLEDAQKRQQLLSRRAYLEFRTNTGGGFGAWTALVSGYVLGVRLITAIEYEITVGDTRRIERTRRIFAGSETAFTARGTLFGGPIVGGWGPVRDRGGWRFRVRTVGTNFVDFTFVNGYRPYDGSPVTTVIRDAMRFPADGIANDAINDTANAYFVKGYGNVPRTVSIGGYPGITVTIPALGILARPLSGDARYPSLINAATGYPTGPTALRLLWPAGASFPTVGQEFLISAYITAVTPASPLFVDLHPVDWATTLWTAHGIAYDAAAAATIKALVGADVRLAVRATEPMLLGEFLERAIYGPFGISARLNSAGELQLFATRLKQTATPSITIATSDLRSFEQTIFDLDEATVASSIRLEMQTFGATSVQSDSSDVPLDGVDVGQMPPVIVESGDVATFGSKEVAYEVPGMIHTAASFAPDPSAEIASMALEIFDRYGHGAASGEVSVLREWAGTPTVNIGDEVYLTASHYPNQNYRIGESSVGARIMQVVRRTEAPEGPLLKLVDAGLAAQPASPAATITIAASASAPRQIAAFTITNAAAINTAAVLQVAVEWAVDPSTPAGNGATFTRYVAAGCPTGAVDLPPVAPGSKVWVRARTEQLGRRPAVWTAWVGVALASVAQPATLTITNIKRELATYDWTGVAVTDSTDLFVFKGTVAPGDWSPYFRKRVPPGATRSVICGLEGPAIDYVAAVAAVDTLDDRGPVRTAAFVTTNLDGRCPAPGNEPVTLASVVFHTQVLRSVILSVEPQTAEIRWRLQPVSTFDDTLPWNSVTNDEGSVTIGAGTLLDPYINVTEPQLLEYYSVSIDGDIEDLHQLTVDANDVPSIGLTLSEPDANVLQIQARLDDDVTDWKAWARRDDSPAPDAEGGRPDDLYLKVVETRDIGTKSFWAGGNGDATSTWYVVARGYDKGGSYHEVSASILITGTAGGGGPALTDLYAVWKFATDVIVVFWNPNAVIVAAAPGDYLVRVLLNQTEIVPLSDAKDAQDGAVSHFALLAVDQAPGYVWVTYHFDIELYAAAAPTVVIGTYQVEHSGWTIDANPGEAIPPSPPPTPVMAPGVSGERSATATWATPDPLYSIEIQFWEDVGDFAGGPGAQHSAFNLSPTTETYEGVDLTLHIFARCRTRYFNAAGESAWSSWSNSVFVTGYGGELI